MLTTLELITEFMIKDLMYSPYPNHFISSETVPDQMYFLLTVLIVTYP